MILARMELSKWYVLNVDMLMTAFHIENGKFLCDLPIHLALYTGSQTLIPIKCLLALKYASIFYLSYRTFGILNKIWSRELREPHDLWERSINDCWLHNILCVAGHNTTNEYVCTPCIDSFVQAMNTIHKSTYVYI